MKNWIGLSNNRLCFIKWISEVCDPCIGKVNVMRRFVFEASQGTLFFSMRSLLAEEWLPLCRTELPRPWTLLFIEIQNSIFGRKIKEVWMRQILSAWKLERVDCITSDAKKNIQRNLPTWLKVIFKIELRYDRTCTFLFYFCQWEEILSKVSLKI